MLNKSIKFKLNNLSKEMEMFPTLNSGGCGLFALTVYDNLSIKNKEIYMVFRDYSKSLTFSKPPKYTLFYHIILKIEDLFYDSDGFLSVPRSSILKSPQDYRNSLLGFYDNRYLKISREYLDHLLKLDVWNHTFRDSKDTEIIPFIIEQVLNK